MHFSVLIIVRGKYDQSASVRIGDVMESLRVDAVFDCVTFHPLVVGGSALRNDALYI